jgi:putative protease
VANFKVGKITHYYDKIGVAVVEVLGTIAVGDKIKLTGSNDFSQEVVSMQIEHEKIKEAKKGQVIGLKLDQAVKKGDEVYRAS